MTKLESADAIIKQNGDCVGISCKECCLTQGVGKYYCGDYTTKMQHRINIAKQYKEEHEMKFKVGDKVKLSVSILQIISKMEHQMVSFLQSQKVFTVSNISVNNTALQFREDLSCFKYKAEWFDKVGDEKPFPYNLKKGDKVVSDCGDKNLEFYSYNPDLKKPFLCKDIDPDGYGDIYNYKDIKPIPKYKAYWKFDKNWKGKQVKEKGFNRILTIIGTHYNWDKKSTEICGITKDDEIFIFSNDNFLKNYTWLEDNTPCGEKIC